VAPSDLRTSLPVYVVGDSHTLPYRNLVVFDKWTGQLVIIRSKYISGLTAHDFFDIEQQEFLPSVFQFLEYEGLVRDGRATHLSREKIDFAIAQAMCQPMTPPLMLFAVGGIDVRGVLVPMLGADYDFVPPFDLPYPTSGMPLVPWDLVAQTIEQRIRPFICGLKQLRDCGFNRLYVQNVVPPTLDDVLAKKLNRGINCSALVRTRLTAAFNRVLASEVSSIGATVLDVWPQVTDQGYLKPEYDLDGVHLPPCVAQTQVERLLEHAINCPWESVNHIRYVQFYRMACNLSPFEGETSR
jgi:hypothetical protein